MKLLTGMPAPYLPEINVIIILTNVTKTLCAPYCVKALQCVMACNLSVISQY